MSWEVVVDVSIVPQAGQCYGVPHTLFAIARVIQGVEKAVHDHDADVTGLEASITSAPITQVLRGGRWNEPTGRVLLLWRSTWWWLRVTLLVLV